MVNELNFSDRTVLITGAGSGIGAACARWLADRGASRLLLVDRDEARIGQLELPCETQAFVGDVADVALWERVEAASGPLDHAVLNAGIAVGAPIVQTSLEDWRQVLAINLDGAFLGLRTALRLLRDGGSAVLTSSVSGLKAAPATAAYATSKAALIQLARVAALEGAERKIRVNTIAPGGVDTPIWDSLPYFQKLIEETGSRAAALEAMAAENTPLARFAAPAEIAGQIGFLLSDMAGNMTGAVLVSDGGYTL